jgi:hypothetical protein
MQYFRDRLLTGNAPGKAFVRIPAHPLQPTGFISVKTIVG